MANLAIFFLNIGLSLAPAQNAESIRWRASFLWTPPPEENAESKQCDAPQEDEDVVFNRCLGGKQKNKQQQAAKQEKEGANSCGQLGLS